MRVHMHIPPGGARCRRCVSSGGVRTLRFLQACEPEPWHRPSLFLYSLADKIVDHRVVERLARARARRPSTPEPQMCRWRHSPHVAHLKESPQDYCETVAQFLVASLTGWAPLTLH